MDIVERLRIRLHTSEDETALTNEAADTIERLREEKGKGQMKSPKFKNGDIVYINPVSSGGLQGKILGVIHYGDGTFGYVVTHVIFGSNGGVQRTFVGEEEIHLVESE